MKLATTCYWCNAPVAEDRKVQERAIRIYTCGTKGAKHPPGPAVYERRCGK